MIGQDVSVLAVGFMGGVLGMLALLGAARLMGVRGAAVASRGEEAAERPERAAPARPRAPGLLGALGIVKPKATPAEIEAARREAQVRQYQIRISNNPRLAGWRVGWDDETQQLVIYRNHDGAPSDGHDVHPTTPDELESMLASPHPGGA